MTAGSVAFYTYTNYELELKSKNKQLLRTFPWEVPEVIFP